MSGTNTSTRIESLVKSNAVVLFMKGTRDAPQCGFSSTVVGILDQYLPDYATVNVLAEPEIRDGIKEFSNWPTIPQLYINSEFVGGCDIIRQLDEEGGLKESLGELVRAPEAPEITITPSAAKIFVQAMADAEGEQKLRLEISSSYQHDLALDTAQPNDLETTSNGITLLVQPGMARRAAGLKIDYVTSPQEGFKIDNPNAPAQVQQVNPAEAQALVASTPELRFLDVRTPHEFKMAAIEGTTLMDTELFEQLMGLPKDTPMLFHCHHGQRSFQAGVHFIENGFTKIYNLVGGIDAWSKEVDSAIPRY